MKYDVIVVGAGPSGLTCGMELAKAGKHCLILEKKQTVGGKVCGDGLSSHCIQVLKKIDICEYDLLTLGGKKIYQNITSNFGKLELRKYCKSEEYEGYAIGLSRDVFDNYLLKLATVAGCEVRFGQTVSKIIKTPSSYYVNETFEAEQIVLACGATGGEKIGITKPANLPVGISARVYGDCKLASDSFYFKYDWQYGTGYAWIFPIGDNLWNYGVWSGDHQKEVKSLFFEFEAGLKKHYFLNMHYDRMPKGALIGATCEDVKKTDFLCVGDCSYIANVESGEGISFAIESGYIMAGKILGDKTCKSITMPTKDGYFYDVKLIKDVQGMII